MLTAAAVALASLPGCAFIFSEGPPPPERQANDTYFDCSDSWVPSITDAVLAGLTGISAGSAYNDRTFANPHGVAAIAAGFTLLFATSAIYGITSVSSCGHAKTARLERKEREALLPPPYGMPPWGEAPPYWPPPVAFYRAPAPVVAPKPAPESPTPTPTAGPLGSPAETGTSSPTRAAPVFKTAPPAQ
jgi:hypothetical protein